MARVINLVNDLVVRRDVCSLSISCPMYACESNWKTYVQREAEHRENLATTIRTLRGNESQQTIEIVRERDREKERGPRN